MLNRKVFLEAVSEPVASLDPAYCALLFSQALKPGLDIDHYLTILQSLTSEAADAHIDCTDSLLSFVNKKHGFHGNPDEYYQIENSLLDKVLDTRTGIPISLALIYLSIGKSIGLSVYGVSFPGHFLVAVSAPEEVALDEPTDRDAAPEHSIKQSDKLIDPFAARVVSRKQCFNLLDSLYQGRVKHNENYFAPAGNDAILLRLIENIKAI